MVDGTTTEEMMVAPYVGAWIETVELPAGGGGSGSHLTWVRGLKPEQRWL